MTPEQKQSELNRLRDILLATIDYLLDQFGRRFVIDQIDWTAEFYQQQKIQTLKNYKQRRLDRLQQRLKSLTRVLQHELDLKFAAYIKEKTGFEIDIFEDFRKRVDLILLRNEILNEQELNDVGMMLRYCRQGLDNGDTADKLQVLLSNYFKRTNDTAESTAPRKRKRGYTEVIRTVESDIERIQVTESTGPKPKHREEQVIISPDGKRRLRITQLGYTNYGSTCIVLEFPTGSGGIYGTNSVRPDIKAFWKNSHTIVIETRKEYEMETLHRTVSSYDDVITIEYIEH